MQTKIEERREARRLLLQRIVEVLKADARFTAAWLTGSLARHADDGLSDIDISVVVDAEYAPSLCQHPWVVAGHTTAERLELFQQFGEPIIIHENHNNVAGEGTFTSVTYRVDALTVDWTLLAAGYIVPPSFDLLLFSKAEYPFQHANRQQNQQERAKAASEKVAFFWMMTTITIKYMLRHDIVFFHMLLDGLHRTFIEVSYLVEGRAWVHRSGSQVRLALTQREQRIAVQAIAKQMEALMPKLIALGGYIPSDPMFAVNYLLDLAPIDDTPPQHPIVDITESDRENIIRFIKALNDEIGKRIYSYIGSNEPKVFRTFLTGFHAAVAYLGLSRFPDGYYAMYEKVVVERGWKFTPRHPYEEMQERGLDNDTVIQELIAIETETWKRTFNIAD